MSSNIDFKNLSQYKYVYKFYFANEKLNIEKFKVVYINKEQIVYVENNIAKLKSLKYFRGTEEIPEILKRIADGWYKGRWTINSYVVSKEKIDTEAIKLDLDYKAYFIEQEILKLEREIKERKFNISMQEDYVNGIERKLNNLRSQINELSEEGEYK